MTLTQEISYLAYIIEAKKSRLLERVTLLESSFNASSAEVSAIVTAIEALNKPITYSVPNHYNPIFTIPSFEV